MPHAIADRAAQVQPGAPQGSSGLCVVPLLGPSSRRPAYRRLEGKAMEKVHVTETSDTGSVPELVVHNDLEQRVFLMDGQELVGAKQNRILNTDVLAPARQRTHIPVSCVEQGRWAYRSRQFAPGRSASSEIRRRKHARVTASLRDSGQHDADQGAVWEEVSESLASSGTSSQTMALNDAYEARQHELVELRRSLRLPRQAVGIAVFGGGRLQGLDLFDRHVTLRYFWESLIDSYGLDHLARRVSVEEPETDPAQAWPEVVEAVASGQWETFPSPGEGEDQRLRHDRFVGSALVWERTSVIHLQLFPAPPADEPRRGRERRRPRLRRRYLDRGPNGSGRPGGTGESGDSGDPERSQGSGDSGT